jgi:hypothetical protein
MVHSLAGLRTPHILQFFPNTTSLLSPGKEEWGEKTSLINYGRPRWLFLPVGVHREQEKKN